MSEDHRTYSVSWDTVAELLSLLYHDGAFVSSALLLSKEFI